MGPALEGSGFPPALAPVLARSLANEPEVRHADVSAWLEDLEAALDAPPAVDGPESVAPGAPTPGMLPRLRSAGLAAAALAVGLVLGAGTMTYLGRDTDEGVQVTRSGDGEVRSLVEVGDARLALIGPEEVAVGEVATFSTQGDSIQDWVWVMPEGSLIGAEPTVSLLASSPGRSTVTLLGTSTEGERVEVSHDLRVVEPEP